MKSSVNRGFATTSIPKKAVQAEEVVAPASDEAPPSDGLSTEATEALADQAGSRGGLPGSENLTGVEQDELQLLQVMVDKYQEKTEKEISRTIKARVFCHPLPAS